MHHDPSDPGLITDHDPDHPKGMNPYNKLPVVQTKL